MRPWQRHGNARAAQLLAGGAIDDVVRQTLTMMVRNVQAVMAQIENDADMAADKKVALLATISDAVSKNTATLRRFAPETDVLAVQLATLKRWPSLSIAAFRSTKTPSASYCSRSARCWPTPQGVAMLECTLRVPLHDDQKGTRCVPEAGVYMANKTSTKDFLCRVHTHGNGRTA